MAGSVLRCRTSGDRKVALVAEDGTMTQFPQIGPEEPRGWSPVGVVLIATLVLLLGFGGALFGIYVANVNGAVASTPTTPPATTPHVPSR
jgi:hypothetical protein